MTQERREIALSLDDAVDTAKDLALSIFVQELMVALAKENYYLDDLLNSLTDYANQRQDWHEVANHLSRAAAAVVKARTDLINRGGQQDED